MKRWRYSDYRTEPDPQKLEEKLWERLEDRTKEELMEALIDMASHVALGKRFGLIPTD